MEISKKVKIGLDETRMQVLGAQILIGFQFRSAFESTFDNLPVWSRYLDGLALLLMVSTLGLLILPGTYHRIRRRGSEFRTVLRAQRFACVLGADPVRPQHWSRRRHHLRAHLGAGGGHRRGIRGHADGGVLLVRARRTRETIARKGGARHDGTSNGQGGRPRSA
jgi:hypothetical protein